MGGSNLTVEVKPSQGALAVGETTTLDLQVKINTTSSAVARPPLNLCLILDKSGSMASEKRLENAKLAIKAIISSLAPSDMLHLVAYSNSAATIFSGGDLSQPQFLHRKVEELKANGGTNLEAGLQEALRVASQFPSPPPRFFVFSDGQVNGGTRRSNEQLLDYVTEIYDSRGIKFSSFGVGKDFNEDLMNGIAEHGMGVYSFIEGASTMESFVSYCLQGIVNAVATEASLIIEPVAPTKLERLFGYPDNSVPLGDLTENNLRQVIAQISITPPAEAKAVKLLTWTLNYRLVGDKQLTSLSGELELPTCPADGDLKVDEEVQSACLVAASSDFDAKVLLAVDAGRAEEALRMQDEQIAMLERAKARDRTGALDSLWTQAVDARKDIDAYSRASGVEREQHSKLAKKKVAHQAYQKRRGSMEFIAKNRK